MERTAEYDGHPRVEIPLDYRYGSQSDEIDEFFRGKRSWSKVKDEILGKYIDCYLKTVQHRGRPILIVDGFAGPGIFGDDSHGSPLIVCKTISARDKGRVGIGCLFADAHPGHRAALERNLAPYIASGVAEKPYTDCAEALSRALQVGAGSTLFFYLDPYGIKDLEFDMVRQIYERAPNQSTEVLINFNFRAFMRMSGNWNYADAADEVDRKVKSSKVDTVDRVMGGDYWRAIVTNPTLTKIAREEAVINAYMVRVRAFFPFVYAIPVKERDDSERGIPEDELARYHLIFGTRSRRAVVYMNDVAKNALDPYFRQFRDGLLFDFTPERYQAMDRNKVKDAIVQSVSSEKRRRPAVYESVMPAYFMDYLKKDYRAMIDELARDGRLFPDKRTIKRPGMLNDDTLLSAQPWPGQD